MVERSGTSAHSSRKNILASLTNSISLPIWRRSRWLFGIFETRRLCKYFREFGISKLWHRKSASFWFHIDFSIGSRSRILPECLLFLGDVGGFGSHGVADCHSSFFLVFVLSRSRYFMQLRDQIWPVRDFFPAKTKTFPLVLIFILLKHRLLLVRSDGRTKRHIVWKFVFSTVPNGGLPLRQLTIIGVKGKLTSKYKICYTQDWAKGSAWFWKTCRHSWRWSCL